MFFTSHRSYTERARKSHHYCRDLHQCHHDTGTPISVLKVYGYSESYMQSPCLQTYAYLNAMLLLYTTSEAGRFGTL